MIGLGLGLAVGLAAIGLGLIGYGATQGMARQPEASGKIQTAMIIALALVEFAVLLTIFALPSAAGNAQKTANEGLKAGISAQP